MVLSAHGSRVARCSSVTSLVLTLTLLIGASGCRSNATVVNDAQTRELARSMQVQLLHSVEAKKRAVLASTVDDAVKFSQESRAAAEALNADRQSLLTLLQTQGTPQEQEVLKAFNQTWARVQTIDAQLLALAVEKTNLQASRLATHEALDELQALVALLDPAAAIAALKIHVLLPGHIASAEDQEMTALEGDMAALRTQVDAALLKKPDPTAGAHWQQYVAHLDEIIRLSRRNSNVTSLQLSMHEKRDAAKACELAMNALLEELDRRPKASR